MNSNQAPSPLLPKIKECRLHPLLLGSHPNVKSRSISQIIKNHSIINQMHHSQQRIPFLKSIFRDRQNSSRIMVEYRNQSKLKPIKQNDKDESVQQIRDHCNKLRMKFITIDNYHKQNTHQEILMKSQKLLTNRIKSKILKFKAMAGAEEKTMRLMKPDLNIIFKARNFESKQQEQGRLCSTEVGEQKLRKREYKKPPIYRQIRQQQGCLGMSSVKGWNNSPQQGEKG